MTLGAAAVVAVALVLILPAAALAVAPTVVTSQAFSTAATTAEVDGTVNPAGQSTTYQVQYDVASSGWCQTQTGSPAHTTGLTPLGFTDNNFHGVTVGLAGLTANTAYCAQVIATNGDGQSVGGQATWTQGIPVSDTFDAFSTGATTATVEGDVNPSGQSTTYKVEYDAASSTWCTSGGSSGSPASTVAGAPFAPTDSSFHDVSIDLTSLTGGTSYCAEIVATNGAGTSQSIQTQWTQGVPSADTFSATSTGATTATVQGDVDPIGQATTYAVQYDVGSSTWCTSFGASGSPAGTTTAQPLGFTDLNFHDVSVDLNGLTAGTAYCAQVIATNGSGQAVGGFTTWMEGTPLADTFGVDSTGTTTATVQGDVNPAGQSTNYAVAYDLASSDWCTSGGTTGSPGNTTTPKALGFTDSTSHDVSVDLSGLTAGSQYCAEVTATNASGEGDGFQQQWTQGLPSAFTSQGVSTGATTATVAGDVNPTGQSTTYAVQYDLANSTWCMSSGFSGSPAHTTSPQPLGFTDTTSHEVSVGLTSLSAGSQYCAQVIATNGSGQGDGGVVTWNQGLPGASTTDAFSTGTVTATVDGAVNPAGQSTDYKVLYDVASSTWCSSSGSSGSPANATTPQTLGFTDNSPHDVSVPLTGLAEGTSYCAELLATNGGGSAHGFQVQWTQGAPTVDTTGAESTGATTATVFGDVNPAGQETTYQVAYGDAGSEWCTSGGFFGAATGTTSATPLGKTDGTSHAVSVGLTGLTPNASYCGEVLATNNDGTGRGSLAFWSQPSATLTVHKAGSGSGGVTSSPAGINCGSTCAAQFDHGTQITLTATPASGSSFGGWSGGGCSGTGTCMVTLNADTTVTATFNTIPPPHTLTVSKAGSGSGGVTSSPAGIDCGSTCAHAFDAGTQVTLTAAASSGSTFAGWSGGGCSGTGTCNVTLNSDTTVTATFNTAAAPTHTLTVTPAGSGSGHVASGPAGIDCGSTCSHAFDAGTQVTLTATADSGSTFTGWSGGGCSGTGNCVVTVNSDTTVTATFTTNSPPPPPPPPTACIVPKLKGKTVAAAKRAINKAHCSVGKITKVASSPKNRGRVVSQSPKPGTHLKKGSKVALKVGK